MTPADSTVLVVDDEPLLCDIVSEWLTFEGYQVLAAGNGAEALHLMASNRVDVILTDIRMPVMDGITFLRKLKVAVEYAPAVIFVSGFGDITPREAFDLGVESMLSKPFRDHQLLSEVQRVLTPREELWRLRGEQTAGQELHATFPTVRLAQQFGKLAFGRGGFCLESAANLREGPVRFLLNFPDEPLRIAGSGTVQWIQPNERQIGVEITGLEADCLAQTIQLTARGGARCYIPRASANL